MKVIIFAFLATVVAGARLENTYLPPGSAQNAGGSGSFLRTPFSGPSSPARFGSFGPSGAVAPSSGFANTPSFSGAAPSQAYGAPASRSFGPSGAGAPGSGFANTPSFSGASPSQAYGAPGSRSFGPSGQAIAILRFNNENNGDGSYRFEYETENRISQVEAGEQRNAGTDQASSVVQGTYSYAGDDGNTYTVNYVADENGFRPEGAHLPTPPPIPAEIQRSLEINAAAEAAGARYDDSGYPAGEGARYRAGGSGQFGGAAGQFGAPGRAGFNSQTGYTY